MAEPVWSAEGSGTISYPTSSSIARRSQGTMNANGTFGLRPSATTESEVSPFVPEPATEVLLGGVLCLAGCARLLRRI